MVNFKVEGLDELGEFGEGALGSFLASFGVLAVFIGILIAIAIVTLWVFSSIGLMNQAKKKNIPNGWLAFIPVGRSYIIGKLGFEVYDKENPNATNFMWITLILGAVSFILGNSKGDLNRLVEFAKLFFESWAFYNMFKALKPKSSVVYTVFTVLSDTLLGGVFLYLLKPVETTNNVEEAVVMNETPTDEKVQDKTTKKNKKESDKVNYCPNCGAKLSKDAKFCTECGKKVN